eukprot:scaffold130148_cov75-Phaeocystis_antarctica.AAC.1
MANAASDESALCSAPKTRVRSAKFIGESALRRAPQTSSRSAGLIGASSRGGKAALVLRGRRPGEDPGDRRMVAQGPAGCESQAGLRLYTQPWPGSAHSSVERPACKVEVMGRSRSPGAPTSAHVAPS